MTAMIRGQKTNLREKQEERIIICCHKHFFVILLCASIYVKKDKYCVKPNNNWNKKC